MEPNFNPLSECNKAHTLILSSYYFSDSQQDRRKRPSKSVDTDSKKKSSKWSISVRRVKSCQRYRKLQPQFQSGSSRHCGAGTLPDRQHINWAFFMLHYTTLFFCLAVSFIWHIIFWLSLKIFFLMLVSFFIQLSCWFSPLCTFFLSHSQPFSRCIKFSTIPVSLLRGEQLFMKTYLLWGAEFAKVPIQLKGQIVCSLLVLNAYSSNCPKQSQDIEKLHDELKAVYFSVYYTLNILMIWSYKLFSNIKTKLDIYEDIICSKRLITTLWKKKRERAIIFFLLEHALCLCMWLN